MFDFFKEYYNFYYWIFVIWGIFSAFYIYRVYKTKKPSAVIKSIYDSIPTVFTTLGVLGTFIGIFIALQLVDFEDLLTDGDKPQSIIGLLDSLKLAFGTSIVGIVLSLIFGKISHIVMENAEKYRDINDDSPVSQEALLLNELIKEVKTNSEILKNFAERGEITSSTVVVLKKEGAGNNQLGKQNKIVDADVNNINFNPFNSTSNSGFDKKADIDLNDGKFVIDKLETNLASAVHGETNPRDTQKLKEAILRGLDPSLSVEQMSQVVVVDHAKEKLEAYNEMRDQLKRLVEVQKEFFKNVAQDIQDELNGFGEEIETLRNAMRESFKQEADVFAKNTAAVEQRLETVNTNIANSAQHLSSEFTSNANAAIRELETIRQSAEANYQNSINQIGNIFNQSQQDMRNNMGMFAQQVQQSNQNATVNTQQVLEHMNNIVNNLNAQYQQLNTKVDAMGVALMDLIERNN